MHVRRQEGGARSVPALAGVMDSGKLLSLPCNESSSGAGADELSPVGLCCATVEELTSVAGTTRKHSYVFVIPSF